MRSEKVIIVGAGVAGLSTAIMLAQRNIESQVLESRQRFDGPTSGVRISAEGVQILKSMNVDSIGENTNRVAMRLGGISVGFTTPDKGAPAIIVTRLALHEKLLERAQSLGAQVVTGFKVASAVESADEVEATSESGEKVTGRLLVGADGVGSAIRQTLNPGQGSTKIYAGYLGAGLITEDEAKIEMTLHRYPGQQVGIASCGKVNRAALKKSIFMWTHLHMPEGEVHPTVRRASLRSARRPAGDRQVVRRARFSPGIEAVLPAALGSRLSLGVNRQRANPVRPPS